MKKALFFILFIVFVAESNAVETCKILDLTPVKWIWYPSGPTLQKTFVLFRKDFNIDKIPQRATGWILTDTRYRLYVNGKEVQWELALSHPRWQEADSLNIAPYLVKGKNVIAVKVCFFATGEGTYVMGKPGLIENLDVGKKQIVTDQSWNCSLAKSWLQGKYKRWFLRALQEHFDARFPYSPTIEKRFRCLFCV